MVEERKTEEYSYPRAFVCTFCKQEFATLGSVFGHMTEMHEEIKNTVESWNYLARIFLLMATLLLWKINVSILSDVSVIDI
jgi:hypothetical protein